MSSGFCRCGRIWSSCITRRRTCMTQLKRAGIQWFSYAHSGLADVTTTIRQVGERVGGPTGGARSGHRHRGAHRRHTCSNGRQAAAADARRLRPRRVRAARHIRERRHGVHPRHGHGRRRRQRLRRSQAGIGAGYDRAPDRAAAGRDPRASRGSDRCGDRGERAQSVGRPVVSSGGRSSGASTSLPISAR